MTRARSFTRLACGLVATALSASAKVTTIPVSVGASTVATAELSASPTVPTEALADALALARQNQKVQEVVVAPTIASRIENDESLDS